MGIKLSKKKLTHEEASLRLGQMRVPIIWVLGSPGSGKSTQCDLLVERYSLWKINVGKIINDRVHHFWSTRGKMLRKLLHKNELIPREVIIEMIREEMLEFIDRSSGYLCDGYPRNIEQGERFEELSAPPSLILYFKCCVTTAKTRLRNRYPGPSVLDEPEASIKKRVKEFHHHIRPILEKYKKRVVRINAEQDLAAIYWECRKHIDRLFDKLGIEIPAAKSDEIPFELMPVAEEDDSDNSYI